MLIKGFSKLNGRRFRVDGWDGELAFMTASLMEDTETPMVWIWGFPHHMILISLGLSGVSPRQVIIRPSLARKDAVGGAAVAQFAPVAVEIEEIGEIEEFIAAIRQILVAVIPEAEEWIGVVK